MDMHLQDLLTPVTVIDHERLTNNIRTMAEIARENTVALRPHIKTHKCIEIAEIQREYGAFGITVATIGEALDFAESGFSDITIAVPISQDKIPTVTSLAERIKVRLLVDHPTTVDALIENHVSNLELDVLMKVDCNYHRSGVDPSSSSAIRLAEKISKASNLRFSGILTHGGHSYYANSKSEIKKIAKEEQQVMVEFAEALKKADSNLEPETVSIGSTPTMMLADEIVDGITEIRPGSYVFFDYTQIRLGSCKPTDCALSVIASVIGAFEDRLIIDAGATSLSLDRGPIHIQEDCGFGQIISDYYLGDFDSSPIVSLSQEHGKVKFLEGTKLGELEPGGRIRIIPNHSCLTANLSNEYYVVEGDEVIATWPVLGRRYTF